MQSAFIPIEAFHGIWLAPDPANPTLPDALGRALNAVSEGGAVGHPQWSENPHVFDEASR